MKPQIGIVLILSVFLGAFIAYVHAPDKTNNPPGVGFEENLQANMSAATEIAVTQSPEEKSGEPSQPYVNVESANGLDEELRGIIEGFDILDEELRSLEGTSTPPAQ